MDKKKRSTFFASALAVSIMGGGFSINASADQWTQIFGTAANSNGYEGSDFASDVAKDSGGNLYISGSYDSSLSCIWSACNKYDAVISKRDSFGNLIWMDILDSDTPTVNNNDQGLAIDVDAAGNSYLMGKQMGT